MSKIWIIIIFACISFVSNAQSNDFNINRIGIGDKVPGELPLMNLVNHSKANATVSDFKGKWLILDYWFTGCGPCIASWPKLMQLQKKYGDKIQIMSVNHMQNKKVVEDFIAGRNKNSKELFMIPSVTGDTVLFKLLPPSGYPTIVWIDPDGVYRATTNGSDLTGERIEAVLKNKNNIQSIVATTTFMNPMRPLFLDGNGGTGQQMLYYSTFSKYSEKIRNGSVTRADSSGYVIAAMNRSILDLIQKAYGQGGPFTNELVYDIRLPLTRIDVRVKDPERLSAISADGRSRNNDNVYTYQLISYQPRTLQQMKEKMKDDIQGYFDLEFTWEKMKKLCLVLTADDTTLLGDNYLGPDRHYGVKNETGFMYVKDVPIDNYFGYLTEYIGGKEGVYNYSYPLINETGFKGGLDLVFENVTQLNYKEALGDYKTINHALAKYKMRFTLEEREVDVLVISDAKTD